MIYALNDQNERINASKAEKGKNYYCPNLDCTNRDLILKKGQIRVPHFAHKSQKDCSYEPESETHIACKMFFQTLLSLDDQFVEFYGIEGVRPDVLYNQFALEIQCSPITNGEIKRRNRTYEKNGYTAIWIFLEDEFISKTKKVLEDPKRSWEFWRLKEHGLTEKGDIKPGAFMESKPIYRIKKPVWHASFKKGSIHNHNILNFKYENENISVSFSEYDAIDGIGYYDTFIKAKKENELVINNKQDFDNILEEILLLINTKKELSTLKKELNSLPKHIQASLYESSELDYPHTGVGSFLIDDEYYRLKIGTFIDEIYRKMNRPMEEFKKRIEDWIYEAKSKKDKIEDWRNQNTFERYGKTYIPLCRIDKINHETPKAYLIYLGWIPKSVSFKDDKYLYCEEWWYKRIEKGLKEKK